MICRLFEIGLDITSQNFIAYKLRSLH